MLSLLPRLSEKAYGLSQTSNVYVFVVPDSATKLTVKSAVESQYKVGVVSVNMIITKGKVVRSYRKRTRGMEGHRSDMKKAYVTLKAGDHIPIFASEDEPKETKKSKKATTTKETK